MVRFCATDSELVLNQLPGRFAPYQILGGAQVFRKHDGLSGLFHAQRPLLSIADYTTEWIPGPMGVSRYSAPSLAANFLFARDKT
jgi:hypothetical protein